MAVVLGGFALGLEPARAHPTRTARDIERDDDPVAHLHPGDSGADLLDDTHCLVAHDVAGMHVGPEEFIQVQVRPADRRRGDLDDDVIGFLDARIGDVGILDFAFRLPGQGLHGSSIGMSAIVAGRRPATADAAQPSGPGLRGRSAPAVAGPGVPDPRRGQANRSHTRCEASSSAAASTAWAGPASRTPGDSTGNPEPAITPAPGPARMMALAWR